MAEREIAHRPFDERAIEGQPGPAAAAGPQVGEAVDTGPHREYSGRLFRKYLLLILSLVTIALLASGAISVYFSYEENKSALASLQHEKALAAATRIEQYVEQIVKQLVYAALPQLDATDVELRRIEFLKLLRQAPEVTDIAQLDGAGREQIAVSRLGMDNIGSGKDRSQEPAFLNARRGQQWFGPVYFKKETEPYMTISIRSGNDTGPVTIADVNLKFIWDVVSRIKIGEKGKAYVVDDNGFLVADPDIGLVLRKTNLAHLPHVKAAAGKPDPDEPAMISLDLANVPVMTSVAPIASLKWNVFIEQPVSEVYAKLNASILRTAALLIAGLVISALAALALARGMVRPIRTLDEGARRIGAGELDQKIEVRTGDELEGLANQFNRMTGRLRESYAGLEQKVEARTLELKNSLEQQTAISEILRVIAGSPGDVRPMLNAVAERALTLCDAAQSTIVLVEGDVLRFAAGVGDTPTLQEGEAMPLTRGSVTGRAIIDGAVMHMEDLALAPEEEFPIGREVQRRIGHHAALSVPLMREERAIGAIVLWRMEARPFTEKQIALVETFADQAAIAIENVRLFNATKEALEQQTAVAEILRAISGSPTDVQPVLDAIAERAAHLCDAAAASMYLTDGTVLRHLASKGPSPDPVSSVEVVPINRDSISGRALLERRTIVVDDMLAAAAEYPQSFEIAQRHGARTLVVVPLSSEDKPFGTIVLRRQEVRPFTERELALLQTFGDQAAIALKNVRLFEEIQEKSRQVEIASQHKMQFLANMSHELRTPLNAILGYAVLLVDGIYGTLDDSVRGVLERVQHNGTHLLGLINDVLDLSKIDAGQVTLALDNYSMSALVKSTVSSTESLAQAKGLALDVSVAEGLPLGWGDERRLTQVLLNMLGNAIKFTDQGKVEVVAAAADGKFSVEVRDTGPGIAIADQARIFEEFQQVDASSTRTKGGTGLGLAIAKRIVEMHGGTISVASELGVGSTFRVVVPIRAEQQREAA